MAPGRTGQARRSAAIPSRRRLGPDICPTARRAVTVGRARRETVPDTAGPEHRGRDRLVRHERSLLALYALNCSALINVSELQPRMRAQARMLQH